MYHRLSHKDIGHVDTCGAWSTREGASVCDPLSDNKNMGIQGFGLVSDMLNSWWLIADASAGRFPSLQKLSLDSIIVMGPLPLKLLTNLELRGRQQGQSCIRSLFSNFMQGQPHLQTLSMRLPFQSREVSVQSYNPVWLMDSCVMSVIPTLGTASKTPLYRGETEAHGCLP